MTDLLTTWGILLAGNFFLIGLTIFALAEPPPYSGGRFRWPSRGFVDENVPFIVLFLIVMAVHFIEISIDEAVTAALGWDFTRQVYALEGHAVAVFQLVQHPLLDYPLIAIYLFGYPFLIYFSPLFYLLMKDSKTLRLCVLTVAITYVFAIPLYLFFPVYDPWVISQDPANTWYAGPVIEFRMPEIWPGVADSYWKFTTTNNEIPSLHSGLSAGLAAVAWSGGHRRFAALATLFAVGIPLASLYIGVHWIVDILVGWLIAGVAFTVASRVHERVNLESLRLFRLTKDSASTNAEKE